MFNFYMLLYILYTEPIYFVSFIRRLKSQIEKKTEKNVT